MLTVKLLHTCGAEEVFEAARVYVRPHQENEPVEEGLKTGALYFDDAEGRTELKATAGRAYVMNDDGRTVAKYELGGWNKVASD